MLLRVVVCRFIFTMVLFLSACSQTQNFHTAQHTYSDRPYGIDPRIELSILAHMKYDVLKEKSILLSIVSDSNNMLDKAFAAQRLGEISWKYENNLKESMEWFSKSQQWGTPAYAVHLARANVFQHAKKYTEAGLEALLAVTKAETETEEWIATVSAQTVSLNAFFADFGNIETDYPKVNFSQIQSELGSLLKNFKDNRVIFQNIKEASRSYLLVALINDDGPAMLEAWHDTFFLQLNHGSIGQLGKADQMLHKVLPKWKGSDSLPEERELLVKALFESTFKEAGLIALLDSRAIGMENFINGSYVKDWIALSKFSYQLDQYLTEQYRLTSVSKSDLLTCQKEVKKLENTLWNKLSWKESYPKDISFFQSELMKRFGVLFNKEDFEHCSFVLGNITGYNEIPIVRYGKNFELDLFLLDGSKTYLEWFFDQGRFISSRWSSERNVQVLINREILMTNANQSWENIQFVHSDGKLLPNQLPIPSEKIVDKISFAKAGLHLWKSVSSQMILELGGWAATPNFRMMGVGRISDLQYEATVNFFATRSVDEMRGITDQDELSFRSLLTEIEFSSDPHYLLAWEMFSIPKVNIHPSFSSKEKILMGYMKWMDEHKAEMKGFDASKTTLEQLYLLSEDQIKNIARGMDPINIPKINF